jgi:hypothetical protein
VPQSPRDRKNIERRRAENQKRRDDAAARDAAIHKRIATLADDAIARARRAPMERPDAVELIARFEELKVLAISCHPPQMAAAVSAVGWEARIAGVIVDRQAVMHAEVDASVLHGSVEEGRERIILKLADQRGMSPRKARLAFEAAQRAFEAAAAADDIEDGDDDDDEAM